MSSPGQQTHQEVIWHAVEVTTALPALSTTDTGLTPAEAAQRLAQYGANVLPNRARRATWLRFADQFNNILIIILLLAAIVTAGMGHLVDTVVIIAVVIINAVIGFLQEGKAERSLEALRHLLTDECMVLRDGQRRSIPARDVVIGDIVLLQSGDRVPADLRLVTVKNLHVDESALTGESVSVSKQIVPVAADAALGDRRCLAFSGTFIASGQCLGVVVATGSQTELGRIQHLLSVVSPLKTPLLIEVEQFARIVSIVVLMLASLAFVLGVWVRDYGVGDMFMIAVALAVAAIPEGLPAVLSITLAIGVQRMAKRNAIIRRLPAVDTLGAVDVICSDKTGTLTCNEMMITDVVLSDSSTIKIDGAGYVPVGELRLNDAQLLANTRPDLVEIARCGALCSDARIEHVADAWQPIGDPIEAALVSLAMKCGLEPITESAHLPRADVIPFESEYRFMATLHRDHHGGAIIYVKGAPEAVLSRCAVSSSLWETRVDALARRGRRVLALARKRLSTWPGELTFDLVAGELELLGIVGAIDPPRAEAVAAIAECHAAGIRVAMITGDHAVTAQAIAGEIGLRSDRVLTGADIDRLDAEQLHRAVTSCEVFARVNPEHKLRIVEILQKDGRTIAMTGDGVNDAPALKRAHIGVAMGKKGTEVAKEAADMVLADDNFSSIAAAVREGRTVFENIRKSIHFMLPVNGGESMVLLAAIVTGYSLPLTPVQILWVNLVSSVTLALSLAVEPSERDLMRRPPRRDGSRLITGHFIWRIALVSTLMCTGTFAMYMWQIEIGASTELARTASVNLLVFCEVTYLLCSRSIFGPAIGKNSPPNNPWTWLAIGGVILLQMLYTYLPLSQSWFGTVAIGPTIWATILIYCAFVFVVVELEKTIFRHLRKEPK